MKNTVCIAISVILLASSFACASSGATADTRPWRHILGDLERANHFAVLEMLCANFFQPSSLEAQGAPDWLVEMVRAGADTGCLPLLGEWVSEIPHLEQTLKESPAYRNIVSQYSLKTLMKTDHEHSAYVNPRIPVSNYYAAYDGSACSGMSWEVTEKSVMQHNTSECDPGRASGSILGAIMLNAGSLNINRPMTAVIDAAGHTGVLALIGDISDLAGTGELSVLDLTHNLIIGAGGETVGVVHSSGLALLHPKILAAAGLQR
jgi:hypothetical protein